MAIRAQRNLFNGVNPLLHSTWQAEYTWEDFHDRHMGDAAGLLREILRPLGYTARMERSLQVVRSDNEMFSPQSDILISDTKHRDSAASPVADSVLTVWDLVRESLEDLSYRAITLYARDRKSRDEPVAWIELLSPTNKGRSADARTYQAKRNMLLESGIVFVEMDYLHETPPTFPSLADYTQGKPNAHPYRIMVLDPRPDLHRGPVYPFEFGVGDRIPQVKIPLNDGDVVFFDFGAAYQKTFTEMGYGLEDIDYAHLPVNFDRYIPADQAKIAARLVAIRRAVDAGADLETADITPVEMPLEEALAVLASASRD